MGPAAQVIAAAPLSGSQASLRLPDAYFHDCYEVAAPDANATALETYLFVVRQTPQLAGSLVHAAGHPAAQDHRQDYSEEDRHHFYPHP